MKIALVIDNFSPVKGGGETYAWNLARLLSSHGHQVHVYTSTVPRHPLPVNITIHQVPTIGRSELLRVLSFGYNSRRLLRNNRFDIIQGFGKSCWYMDVFRPGGGIHRAYLQQNLLSLETPFYRLYRQLLRKTSLKDWIFLAIERFQYEGAGLKQVITNSHLTKGDLLRFYPYPANHIGVIYNGVDPTRFYPGRGERRKGGERSLSLLFVAHNFRLKGLSCLIKALSAVMTAEPRINLRLFIAGRGRQTPYIRYAQQLGCADRLVFLGPVADMPSCYRAADILVHPTFYDPSANVCWEAAASGLPVITTNFNGFSELMGEGLEEYVLPDPRDTDRLRDAILKLLEEDRRREIGERLRTIVGQYTLERNYQEVMEVYRQVLARGESGHAGRVAVQ